MRELAAATSVLIGFTCWSFAVPSRRPKRWQSLRLPPRVAYGAGFAALALSVAVLWAEGASYAWLFTLTSACAVATIFTLAAPVLLREPSTPWEPRSRERTRPLFTFRLSTLALIFLSLVGTVPGAILSGLGLTLALPFELETRLAIGFGLIFAFWLTAVCLVWLSKSSVRAFGWCIAFAAFGGLLVGKTP